MLLATSTVLHQVFSVDKTPKQAMNVGIIIYTSLAAFTLYHCITDELILHQVFFGMALLFHSNSIHNQSPFHLPSNLVTLPLNPLNHNN